MKREPSDLEAWPDMEPFDRNWLIGGLLGAEPMVQFYVKVNGAVVSQLTPRSLDECEAVMANLRGKHWSRFAKDYGLSADCRQKLELHKEEWHIRYCNTSGGGWVVIEYLRKLGCAVAIESADKAGWKVVAITRPDHRNITATCETMEEAACLALLRVLDRKEAE